MNGSSWSWTDGEGAWTDGLWTDGEGAEGEDLWTGEGGMNRMNWKNKLDTVN